MNAHPQLDWDDNSGSGTDHYHVYRQICPPGGSCGSWYVIASPGTSSFTDFQIIITPIGSQMGRVPYKVSAVGTNGSESSLVWPDYPPIPLDGKMEYN